MANKEIKRARADYARMIRNETALTKSVLNYADSCGMDIRRFEPVVTQMSRLKLRIRFHCEPTPESQEVLRQLWHNIERHALFPQQEGFTFSGPTEHGSLKEPEINIDLGRYPPSAYGESIDRNAITELTERFNTAAKAQRQTPVAGFKSTGSTHLFRTRGGMHTHQDLKLFAAVDALAAAHGLPHEDNGSCTLRAAVEQNKKLYIEFHGESGKIARQTAQFKSVLQEAGIRDSAGFKETDWCIPKEGTLMHWPAERDYFGQIFRIDLAENGGIDKLTKKLEKAAQDKRIDRHSARIREERSASPVGRSLRGY